MRGGEHLEMHSGAVLLLSLPPTSVSEVHPRARSSWVESSEIKAPDIMSPVLVFY
jgi:hypothetical protein